MINPWVVLVTKGKHESVDYAQVRLFMDKIAAEDFCESVRTGKQKHWVEAEVVRDSFEVELMQPEDE